MINLPATQFPTPALNDWSRRTAFMGAFRFKTNGVKSSKVGMDKIGSKPSFEIGGSSRGSAQSLMRPRRRTSRNASSSVSDAVLFGSVRCSMNLTGVSVARRSVIGTYLHKLWRPGLVWFLWSFLVVHRRLALQLSSPVVSQVERRWNTAEERTLSIPVMPK